MSVIDVVLVGYRSEMFLPRLREDLKSMSSLRVQVHYFDNGKNEKTLSRIWNDLAALGGGKYIAIMNPDIALCPNWDGRLTSVLDEHHDIAFATPDPFGSSPTAEPMPSRERMREISVSASGNRSLTTDPIQFYVAVTTRATWNRLKGVDERMRFYMSDSDIIRRAQESFGLRSVRVHACPIWHQGSASTAAALEHKKLDQKLEYDTSFSVWKKVWGDKSLKAWHWMTDRERAEVRSHPVYSKMGGK